MQHGESGGCGGIAQTRVGAEKVAARRTGAAPDQRGGQLQAVGGAQGVGVENLLGRFAYGITGKNFLPLIHERLKTFFGFGLLCVRQVARAMDSCDGAVNLDSCAPPHSHLELLRQCCSPLTGVLRQTEGDENA